MIRWNCLARLALVGLLFLLSACTATVRTHVVAFAADDQVDLSTIAMVAPPSVDDVPLEYQHYGKAIISKLESLGFRALSENDPESQYVAYLKYSVVESESNGSQVYTGVVGRSYVRSSGPFVDVMVVDKNRRHFYERRIEVVIAERQSNKRVYEVSGTSYGQCGVLSVVFDEMLDAMFLDFPMDSGALKKIKTNGNASC